MFSGTIGFGQITQAQWDELAAGKPIVSDLVQQYKEMITSMGFQAMLLKVLAEFTAVQILERVEKERPDLKIGDRTNAVARIEAEMKRVAAILQAG